MLNRIIIMGRLTRDPELRRTQSGIPVTSFTLAVDRDFQSRDSAEKQTDFIDCVAWRNTAEFVSRWFTKGRMAVVQGRLQIRDWTDRDGNKRKSAEIVADNVYFGDSRRDGDNGGAPGYGGGYNSGSGYSGYGSGYGSSGSGYGGYGSGSGSGYSGPAPGYGNASGYGSSAPGYGGSSADALGYGGSNSSDAPGYGGKSDYNGASGYGSDGHDNAYTPPAETPPSDFAEIGDEDGDLPF